MLLSAHGNSKGKVGVFIIISTWNIVSSTSAFPRLDTILSTFQICGEMQRFGGSNPDNGWVEEHLIVSKDVKDVNPGDYKGFL